MLVYDLKRAARILGHRDTGSREDPVRRRFWDLDPERQLVSYAHGVRLLPIHSVDHDLGKRRLG